MNIEFCSYCDFDYNLTNRLPQCLYCGHTYCKSCTIYFCKQMGNHFCPACNKFEKINNCDMNIIDKMKILNFCMIHNLPIVYSSIEKGFACNACKDEAPNFEYNQMIIGDQQKVIEKIREFKFDMDAEKNIPFVKRVLKEKLIKIKEEKLREIAEIKKKYKDQKNNIKECLELLIKANRIYSQSNIKNQFNLNLNLICILYQEKIKEKQSIINTISPSSHGKKYWLEEFKKFSAEKRKWRKLWASDNLYIFFYSFYDCPNSSYTVHIKKTLRITLLNSRPGSEKPRNLVGIGFSSPKYSEGFGQYTIITIYMKNEGNYNSILQRLSPISVSYDPEEYVAYYDLNQQICLVDNYTYYIVYEYYGSPTYLGVLPSVNNLNFTFAEVDIDTNKEFICTEGQIQYLILHGLC
ncbi:hypothetical protein SteCoe_26805 [Stentor coeruleus]|uniref:RING-type domain-containing protein n=1 Tax=Stentor coeruleus TaxID=5963 RepID=A0A1R2BCG4_9CILI|nr:hypothetical protein SteCoe_26805 [Stentor coeruleus]